MTVTLFASCFMTSVNKSRYGKKSPESSSSSSPALHSAAISGFVIHSTFPPQQPLRSKRRQVKNTCTHCQKACKKCDNARPCLRCVKYGISEECVDSQWKERPKGLKRGPYKKHVRKGVFPVPRLSRPSQIYLLMAQAPASTISMCPPRTQTVLRCPIIDQSQSSTSMFLDGGSPHL